MELPEVVYDVQMKIDTIPNVPTTATGMYEMTWGTYLFAIDQNLEISQKMFWSSWKQILWYK